MTAFNNADWDALRATVADDSVYEEHGTQRRIEGAGAIMDVYRAWKTAMPDVHGSVQNIATNGDSAVLEVVWEGTQTGLLETLDGTIPPSGKSQRTPGAFAVSVQGGLITSSRNYFDMLTFLQQIEAAPAFFGWVNGSGSRSRERIQAITGAMSRPALDQLVREWNQFYPDQAAGVANGEEFKRRLDADELDAQASRLHTQLLDVSLSSVDAPQYGNLAQDENALLVQVAFEEGAEGLKRGAELNVEATLAVLNTAFPGIQDGVDYAKQADEYAEYAGDVYNDPTGAALAVIKDELDERLVEPLGERLDEGFESAFGEDLAGLISDVASDAVGFEVPSEALAAGVDAGFVEFESNVRAALATNEEAGEGEATLTVIVPDEEHLRVALPPGDYDVLVVVGSGDEAMVSDDAVMVTGGATVAVLPGGGPSTVAEPPAGGKDADPDQDTDGDGITDDIDFCDERPEDYDGFEDIDGCPDLDNDSDNILDGDDECPNLAETVNQFEGSDGCPDDAPGEPLDEDPDRDEILGDADQCPNEAEDINGFEDSDGCPEGGPDPDGDGILGAADHCRYEAETENGFEDSDGCPDEVPNPDPDGDKIVGAADQCPQEAGDVNGFEDSDGCPEGGADPDGDGILSPADQCRFEAETVNQFEDDDGCPDIAPPPDPGEPFSGAWHSSAACGNPTAPWRWEITINPSTTSGTISFHDCPGGGRVSYILGGGTVVGPNQMTFIGLINPFSVGGALGANAAGLVEFLITFNAAPDPNLAP